MLWRRTVLQVAGSVARTGVAAGVVEGSPQPLAPASWPGGRCSAGLQEPETCLGNFTSRSGPGSPSYS